MSAEIHPVTTKRPEKLRRVRGAEPAAELLPLFVDASAASMDDKFAT
jgi:hypothetical protein